MSPTQNTMDRMVKEMQQRGWDVTIRGSRNQGVSWEVDDPFGTILFDKHGEYLGKVDAPWVRLCRKNGAKDGALQIADRIITIMNSPVPNRRLLLKLVAEYETWRDTSLDLVRGLGEPDLPAE